MQLTIEEAQTRLTDLIATAESGTEVILTRNGHPAAQLIPIQTQAAEPSVESFLAELRAIPFSGPSDGPSAARSQDFLYDENGLPA